METFYMGLIIYFAIIFIHGFYRVGLELGAERAPQNPAHRVVFVEKSVSDMEIQTNYCPDHVLKHTKAEMVQSILDELRRCIVFHKKRDAQMNATRYRASIRIV